MTAPTYKCEVAFTTDPLSSSPSYTDITAYLRGFNIRRGRQTELERTQAGTADIVLSNTDRRFDPTYGDQNLFPRVNQRDVEAALDANDFNAVAGATFARTTTAGQFNQGIAGLSVTAHATNANSGISVGSASGTTFLAPVTTLQTYTFSYYGRSSAGTILIHHSIDWCDAAGAVISTTTGADSVNTTFARKSHAAATPPAGAKYARCRVTIDNAAGGTIYLDQFQFERAQTASDWISAGPYYPNVLPMRRIRLTMTHLGVDYRLFTGFVEDWGQNYAPRPIQGAGTAEVTIRAADAFKVISLFELAMYSDEILADEPVGYWRLAEPDSSRIAVNEGSAAAPGTYSGSDIDPGIVGPLAGGQTAVEFFGVFAVSAISMGTVADLTPPASGETFEFWMRPDTYSFPMCVLNRGGIGQVYVSLASTDGRLSYSHATSVGQRTVSTPVVLGATGTWQHVAIVRDGATVLFYVNGTLVHTGTLTGAPQPVAGAFTIGQQSGVDIFDGGLAQIALYHRPLTPERIKAHYLRPTETFAVQKTGTAIGAVLDAIGWPAGDRDLDAGKNTLPVYTASGSALDYLLAIAEDAERGFLFVAGDGKVTFRDRDTLLGTTTFAADFGDGTFGTTSELNYADITLRYDDAFLYSVVTVGRAGAASVTVSDATSKTRYGPRTLALDSLVVASDNETIDLANYLLTLYKDPHLRFDSMTLIGANNNFHLNEIHNRKLGDRVTVERRPPGGGLIYQPVEIVGIDHDMPTVGVIKTTFRLAPVRNWPTTFWILGNTTYSVLDSTTTLGY